MDYGLGGSSNKSAEFSMYDLEDSTLNFTLSTRFLDSIKNITENATQAVNTTAKTNSSTVTSFKEISSKIPYLIYQNKNPFFQQYTADYLKSTIFKNWTETRFFKP